MEESDPFSNCFGSDGGHGGVLCFCKHWRGTEVGCPQPCGCVALALEDELVALLDENVAFVEGCDASGVTELADGDERRLHLLK